MCAVTLPGSPPASQDDQAKSSRWRTWTPAGYISIVQSVIVVITAVAAIGALWFSYQSNQLYTRTQQLANRFRTATELIESDDVSIRVGGIYSLEQIVQDSPDDGPAVLGLLASYIRSNAPITPKCSPKTSSGIRVATDVQAALTVLGRLGVPTGRVDLTYACLVNASLSGAKLSGVDLTGTNLGGVDLTGANLIGADLERVQLTDAQITGGAALSRADLTDAVLTGARIGQEPSTFLRDIFYNANTAWPADFTPPPSRPKL